MFPRITATTNQRCERAKRRDSGFIGDWGASLSGQVTSRRYRHAAVHLVISHFYASKMRACSWGVLQGPCEAFITCNWGFVFLTATPLTAFFFPFFSAPLQEWSKSICLTFVHNIWPLGYSAVQLINNATSAHVFPFTTPSKRNTSSRLLLSSPFPQQWVLFSDPVRGENRLFTMNTMKCSKAWSIVQKTSLVDDPLPAGPPSTPLRCVDHESGRTCIKWSVWGKKLSLQHVDFKEFMLDTGWAIKIDGSSRGDHSNVSYLIHSTPRRTYVQYDANDSIKH